MAKEHREHIANLPVELYRENLFNYLSDQDLHRLFSTSRTMAGVCQSTLQERKDKKLQKLLSHIVKSEVVEALNMIRAYPQFLYYSSEATDYSNRHYKGYTPFQVALLCHNVVLWKQMELIFQMLPNGRADMARQAYAIFPEGVPKPAPFNFNPLIEVITNSLQADIDAALQKTQNDTALCRALTQFRCDFTALSLSESFFNPMHLIVALNIYNTRGEIWTLGQLDLFWQQVIGYTQRFVPACYAQVFVQGLWCISQNPLEFKLKFKNNDGSYFPLDDSSGLGFDFAIGVGAAWDPGRVGNRPPPGSTWFCEMLNKHVEKIWGHFASTEADVYKELVRVKTNIDNLDRIVNILAGPREETRRAVVRRQPYAGDLWAFTARSIDALLQEVDDGFLYEMGRCIERGQNQGMDSIKRSVQFVLPEAAKLGLTRVVQVLIHLPGADVNKKVLYLCKSAYEESHGTKHTPLHLAAARGHTSIVRLLLTKNPKMIDHALHEAANREVAELLVGYCIEQRQDINTKNSLGFALVDYADKWRLNLDAPCERLPFRIRIGN